MRIFLFVVIYDNSLAARRGLHSCAAAVCRNIAKMCEKFSTIVLLFTSYVSPSQGTFFIVPSDVSTGLLTVYGFAPPLLFGTESKLGWGFSLGPHADFQILYEFGPTVDSRPLRVRASRRNRHARRPLIHLLIKAGLLDSPNQPRTIEDDDEPR